jgi:hypothetical protein
MLQLMFLCGPCYGQIKVDKMGGSYKKHEKDENPYKILVGNLKGKT